MALSTSTPWGPAQQETQIAHDIRSVSTAGHGGVLVSRTKNIQIPDYMRRSDGAYEEDCDWCIPAVVFEQEWRAWADSTKWTNGEFQMECAWSSLRNWHPDAYEKFTGSQLQIGESYIRDERLLKAQTRAQYVVRSAWGDWHENVPTGMVGVSAYRECDGDQKVFLVPETEYQEHNTRLGKASCFVVVPTLHKEIAPIS